MASREHLGLVLMGQNRRAQNRPWRPNSEMVLKWRSALNFYLFGLRNLYLGIWGAFGISFDGQKLDDSELTIKAKL